MLQSIPNELIELIASFLHREDLSALRLVNRLLSSASTVAYATQWLRELHFDFSHRSLLRVDYIAQHGTLRHFPKRMIVNDLDQKHPLGLQSDWSRDEFGRIDTASTIFASFRRSLQGLARCRSFVIYDYYIPGFAGWTITFTAMDAVQVLLSCVVDLPVQEFIIDFRNAPPPDPKELSRDLVKTASFRDIWGQQLKLLGLGWFIGDVGLDNNDSEELMELSVDLVTASANAHTLILDGGGELYDRFLARLTEATILAPAKKLRLGFAFDDEEFVPETLVQHDILSAFLRRFSSTLTSVSLSEIRISDGSWGDILKLLRTEFVQLYRVELQSTIGFGDDGVQRLQFPCSHLKQLISGFGEVFCKSRDDDEKALTAFTFEGKDMPKALNFLEDTLRDAED
jgi:hypothetical protein